jgi:RimJ/RimL family protein N-acetyltransferase
MIAPTLESERLIYKPVSLMHLSQQYVEWLNDTEVNKYLESGGGYTLEMLEAFLTEIEKKDIFFWAIHLKSTGKHIGNIKIDPINKKHNTAEYGIMMGERAEWGKGYAKEATLHIIKFCFEELNIRKITLGVISENNNALNLYKKIGFETEGLYKKHLNYHGKYYDAIRMAIFNPQFTYDQ